MILLTEQTRDWERGRPEIVIAGLRRYVVGSALLMAAILVPGASSLMPWLVRLLLGADYAPATGAAPLVLVAAAIQLVFGWTKSFPVTIGRPGLRLVAHGVEAAVLLPLIVVFGELLGRDRRRRRPCSSRRSRSRSSGGRPHPARLAARRRFGARRSPYL